MSRKQIWIVPGETGVHEVTYRCSYWTGKSVLTIDGEAFVQKLKPLYLNVKRREIFRLGEEQCVLCVRSNGTAEILHRGIPVPEWKQKR